MVNVPFHGKTVPNESFTRKKIEAHKATLRIPFETGKQALRDWGPQNKRFNSEP